MQITLTSKEFDEAVSLWLKEQGFTTDRYDISTRVIAGRSDGPLGTRIEATLEPLSRSEILSSAGILTPEVAESIVVNSTRRFGQGQSHE